MGFKLALTTVLVMHLQQHGYGKPRSYVLWLCYSVAALEGVRVC